MNIVKTCYPKPELLTYLSLENLFFCNLFFNFLKVFWVLFYWLFTVTGRPNEFTNWFSTGLSKKKLKIILIIIFYPSLILIFGPKNSVGNICRMFRKVVWKTKIWVSVSVDGIRFRHYKYYFETNTDKGLPTKLCVTADDSTQKNYWSGSNSVSRDKFCRIWLRIPYAYAGNINTILKNIKIVEVYRSPPRRCILCHSCNLLGIKYVLYAHVVVFHFFGLTSWLFFFRTVSSSFSWTFDSLF